MKKTETKSTVLLQLCELELIDRERRASERRLKAANRHGRMIFPSFYFQHDRNDVKLIF